MVYGFTINNHYILNITNISSLNNFKPGDIVKFLLLVSNTTFTNNAVENLLYTSYAIINDTFNGSCDDLFVCNFAIPNESLQVLEATLNNQYDILKFNAFKGNSAIVVNIPNGNVGDTVNITIQVNESINITSNVIITNKTFDNVVFVNGVSTISYTIEKAYENNLNITFIDNNAHNGNNTIVNINFTKTNSFLSINNITVKKGETITISATLSDSNDNPLFNKIIMFYINSEYIGHSTTNNEKKAPINYTTLISGSFNLEATFKGDELYFLANISTSLIVNDNPNNKTTNDPIKPAKPNYIQVDNNKTNKTSNNISSTGPMKNTGIPLIAVILVLLTSLEFVLTKTEINNFLRRYINFHISSF